MATGQASIMRMDYSQDKIAALRVLMNNEGLDGYIVPKADEFQGEFVAPYAERLKWLTDFSGSAGVAIVLYNNAVVMSDGRYTLQLKTQVDSRVFETGDSINTGIDGWLNENADEDAVIGYDPMLFTAEQIDKLEREAGAFVFKAVENNLVDEIWEDQPEKPSGKVEVFCEKIAGRSVQDKKQQIVEEIEKQDVDLCILTLPDSIAWLLNVRGSDIEYIPSVLSYAIVHADASKPIQWITEKSKLDEGVLAHLQDHVEIVGMDVLEELQTETVMMDFSAAPIWFKHDLEQREITIRNVKDPCIAPKAVKTSTEYEAITKAHIADGVAIVKFLHWLDTNTPNADIGELVAQEQLLAFRKEQEAFKQPSFPTIAGYGSNGAIVHYRSSEKSNQALSGGSLFLVDSGGQYYDGEKIAGTTDITRTIAIGKPTEEMIENFSRVLKGHVAVARAIFPHGTIGAQVDTLARQPLWDVHLDFAHGTGHGVGCYLAVHEEAANISPRGKTMFEKGMLISNEPGYYKSGEYGIRIENLVYVRETGEVNSNDKPMLEFETVSFAPIDRRLINPGILNEDELGWLNRYHQKTYDVLKEHLDEDVREWLKEQTAPIG